MKQDFIIPCFIEVLQPPIQKPGKTAKGDKWIKQAPVTEGPVDLTPKLLWQKFLKRVKQELEISTEDIEKAVAGTTWGIRKHRNLPLKDAHSYFRKSQARMPIRPWSSFPSLHPLACPRKVKLKTKKTKLQRQMKVITKIQYMGRR